MTIPQALAHALQHHQAGRLAEAEALYRQILAVAPDHAEALHLLGVLAHQAGRSDLAVELIGQASALRPEDAAVHSNLGEAFRQLGKWEDAGTAYRRALALDPNLAEAHNNLGIVLKNQGLLDAAVAEYRRAIECRPDYADAHYNLGNALARLGQFDAAGTAFRRTLELRPAFADAHNNLGMVLKDQGRIDEALAAFRAALRHRPGDFEAHSNLLFVLAYRPGMTRAESFQEHTHWAEGYAAPLAAALEPHANAPHPERRLRIGYVSPDFCAHPVATFLASLLASHDRAAVEVFCYADLRQSDEVTARLREQAGCWREITELTDAQAAALVREDQIDILVDLAGHTAGHRLLLFARQPAPVQVTWLGDVGTTGLRTMDYRLTDLHADPPGTGDEFYTERLIRLPETFAVFRPAEEAPPVAPRPALARGRVTFLSPHTLAKINEPTLECWVQILHRVPGSRLVMVARGLGESSGRQRWREFFAERGIGRERLDLRGTLPLAEYLALHGEVDVLLDAHPFSGHTVSCHALWMGVPVVTLAGDRHAARMVASVLQNVGLPELIAHTPEQYVELAVGLATDLPRLAELRAGLRARMAASPLLDGPRFARNVEAAYREMWRTWCGHRTSLSPP